MSSSERKKRHKLKIERLLRKSDGEDIHQHFTKACVRVAVSQLTEAAGFHKTPMSALNTLTDVTGRYIQELCVIARDYAELAGRTEVNVYDVRRSCGDLHNDINEVIEFFENSDQIMFAKVVPSVPLPRDVVICEPSAIDKRIARTNSAATAAMSNGTHQATSAAAAAAAAAAPPQAPPPPSSNDVAARTQHIPDVLPAFPTARTHRPTPVFRQRNEDPKMLRKRQIEENIQVEANLRRLKPNVVPPNYMTGIHNLHDTTAPTTATTNGNNDINTDS